jgi:hypothetical protein
MQNSLNQFLLGYEKINENEIKTILKSFETVSLKKDDCILKEGQVCTFI